MAIIKMITREDYDKAITLLEDLTRKPEQELTDSETELIRKAALLAASFEEGNEMTPISRDAVSENETDIDKIASVLGYQPDLASLIQFKLFQKKMNQTDLAKMLNMSKSKVSQIMNKKQEPDIAFLKGVHEKLGIDGNLLLEYA